MSNTIQAEPANAVVLSSADTIRHLFSEVEALAQDTRSRGRMAVAKAAECGDLLRKERARIEDQHGKGAWSKYVEDVLKIPESTARGWMKLADSVMLESGDIDSNAMRQGMLSLDIFPAKEHDPIPGDVPLPKVMSHLTLVNRFDAWKRALTKSGRKLTKPEREQLKADFRKMVEFLKDIGAI